MMIKFALHNFSGHPVRYFLADAEDVSKVQAKPAPAPTHHIAILDVSGSMWGDLDAVKSTIEKVFTAEEFNDPSQKVSLLTYASHGDCRVHFQRVTVAEVLAPNSPHLKEIRNLTTRGMTGISQALQQAERMIDDSEVTCISLHTDGYANDPSPYSEAQNILGVVQHIEKHPNVFCNTVGYRNYCDFALLTALANRLSGTCVRATTAREVYEALHASQTLLAGNMAPVIEAGIGDFDFIGFVSRKGRKVLGGTESLTIRGLGAGDDATVYRYREVSEADYNAAQASQDDMEALLVYCRAQIALGNLNVAKYAMVSTRIQNLIAPHARALVASEVAAWAGSVEQFLFEPTTTVIQSRTYGLANTGPSVLSVLNTLNKYSTGLRLDVDTFLKGYKRRGLKRVAGRRDDDGTFVPPTHMLVVEDNPFVPVTGIEINRTTATANIKTARPATLVEIASGATVSEVAGIPLDLSEFRSYTVVGDGVVTSPVLPIKFTDKRLFGWLKQYGLVQGDFDPQIRYDISLSGLPLVDFDQDFQDIPLVKFHQLAVLTVLQKLLSGLIKEESAALTPEQVEALSACYLSKSLYFNPPTTNPYKDLGDAIAAGEVDTRLSYEVMVGTPDILNLGKLHSGNAYLQRRFTLKLADGTTVEKPTLDMWWKDGNTWGVKELGPRTKLTKVDDLTYPIYEGFIIGEDRKTLYHALRLAYVDADMFMDALDGGLDHDEAVDVFQRAQKAVDAAIDSLYGETFAPLAFYVGSTGLVPDSFGATAMTAEQLTAKHPSVSLGKAEKEGTFYELPGGLILSVFTEASYFSTDRGVKAANNIGRGTE